MVEVMVLVIKFSLLFFLQIWHFEIIPGVNHQYIALDVDSCGIPAIAFWQDSTVYYAQRTIIADSVVWQAESVAATPFHAICYSQEFAVGKNSRPHILYHQWHTFPYFLDLYYATKDSVGLWYSALIDTIAWGGAIDTDSCDSPCIVLRCRGLCYLSWDGTNWIRDFIDSTLDFVSLKVDKNDNPHIGLGAPVTCNDDQIGYTGYVYKDSTGWHHVYMTQYDVRWPVGIDADDEGKPHLAFSIYYDSCYHLVKEDSQWSVDNVTAYGYFGSLIGVSNVTVHLLGVNEYGSMVRHAWKQDSVWLTEDIHPGYPEDYVVDQDGYSHCLIVENTTVIYGTDRPQVDVFERTAGVFSPPLAAVVSRFPLMISLSKHDVGIDITIIDIYGRLVKKLSRSQDKMYVVWDGLDANHRRMGNGVYFVVLRSSDEIQVRKIVVVR